MAENVLVAALLFIRWKCAERMKINRRDGETVGQRSIYLPADGNSVGLFRKANRILYYENTLISVCQYMQMSL